MTDDRETALLAKLNEAVAWENAAVEAAATAQAELVSRAKAVGMLLLDARKLHPKVKDFEVFLNKVHGLKLSRAYDLLRLAGGRTTDEELKKENRERQQKSRTKKKLPKPKPEPVAVSVTVTESLEASTEARKAEFAAMDAAADTMPHDPYFDPQTSDEPQTAKLRASLKALAEFKYAADKWLPMLAPGERTSAQVYVRDFFTAKVKAA